VSEDQFGLRVSSTLCLDYSGFDAVLFTNLYWHFEFASLRHRVPSLGFSARSGGITRACGVRISLDQSTSVSFKVPLAALTDGGTFCAPRDGRMRCDGGLIRQFAPSQSSIPVMPPLNGLLEGTWDSRFATLFALRKSVR